jgi:hypothetical protein
MKFLKLSVVFYFLAALSIAIAQVAKPLQFKEELFDFGQVKEGDGPVTHQFEFTNTFGRPVKIINVKPSCGCTTPDWTREPVMPGKTGFIQARFDPKGRPGFFNKSLTVTTDADGGSLVLQIKGTVSSGEATVATEFENAVGNWKVKSKSFNLGKIFLKDEFVANEYEILNSSSKPISYLNKFDGPTHIKISVEPKTLAPGEKGIIKLSYNGKQKNQYGFQSDNIVIHTDDELEPKKSFTVFATLEDYFPKPTPAELAKAPKLRVSSSALDFGRVRQNFDNVKDFSITNYGKSNLEVRDIQGNCTCIKTQYDKKVLKPGESVIVKIFFNPEDRKGTHQKAVTVYSNDPQSPVQRVTFTAYVED